MGKIFRSYVDDYTDNNYGIFTYWQIFNNNNIIITGVTESLDAGRLLPEVNNYIMCRYHVVTNNCDLVE